MLRTLLITLGFFMTTAATAADPRVKFETSLGDIVLELNPAKAPITVQNFLDYVKAGHYDGLRFHRVIKGFMIQGGGYDEKYEQRKTRAGIQNEAKNGLKNVRGAISMARTSAPHSASSQFFILHQDSSFLDYPGQDGWGYAVFGKVVSGMDVVDKIAESKTGRLPPFGQDVPLAPILIKKATLEAATAK